MQEKYCSKCGSALKAKAEGGRQRAWCAACGHIVFGHFSLGVGGLLTNAGRVLLVQRAQEPGRGRWTLPGGYAEEDEPPDEAVVREVLEETGLRVTTVGLLAIRHALGAENQNLYYVFELALAGPVEDLREAGDGHEIAHAGLYRLAALDAVGELGLISRWVIEQYAAGMSSLRRVPDAILPQTLPSHRWTAVFAGVSRSDR